MAVHEIEMKIPKADVSRVDVEFEVWEDDVKLGTLLLSKGDLRWRPANWARRSAVRVSWTRFDDWMRSNRRR